MEHDALDARLELGISDGTIDIRQMQASWLGGTVSGNGAFGTRDSTGFLRSQFAVTGIEAARLLAEAGIEAPVSGVLELGGSLEGVGKSAAALVQALTGSGTLSLEDGTLAPSIPLRSRPFSLLPMRRISRSRHRRSIRWPGG